MDDLANRAFLLTRRWSHHANHSGYDMLARFIGQPLSAEPIPDFLLSDRHVRRLQRSMRGYDRTSVALELLASWHMARHRNCLYHILYGDSCYNYLARLNGWRGHRIIASFHHPPRKFAEFVQKNEALKRLSAAIILGKNQYASFENILPIERVVFIPYAVETSFFTPPDDFSKREDNLCLFVGAHLRDLTTLCKVIDDAQIVAPHVTFAIVAHPNNLTTFKGVAGNFEVYSGISERELLNLYRTATVMILPLQDAVANTTLLEGMACGLPIIVTDVGAVRDYVDEDAARFVPPLNAEAMLDAITCLLDDPEKRRRLSANARSRALKFDWNLIALQMREVYARVLSRN